MELELKQLKLNPVTVTVTRFSLNRGLQLHKTNLQGTLLR